MRKAIASGHMTVEPDGISKSFALKVQFAGMWLRIASIKAEELGR